MTSGALQRSTGEGYDRVRLETALEGLIARLFSRALQLVGVAVALSVAMVCFDASARTTSQIAAGGVLSLLAILAIVWQGRLLSALRRRSWLLVAPTVITIGAVLVSGGTESAYFGVLVASVAVPVTLGRPVYALGCALLGSVFQLAAGLASPGFDWAAWSANSAAIFAAAAAGSAGVWTFAMSVRAIPDRLAEVRAQERAAPVVRALAPAPLRTAGLSPREREVLAVMAQGRTPAQAARELGIELSTVRSHLKRAKRQTGARTLPELVGIVAEELS